jgi:arylsulfatase A-like enzyme
LADPTDPESYKKFQQPDFSSILMKKEALGFIEDNSQHPFFMLYASPLPHVPLQAPQKWVKYYQQKLGDEKPYLGNKGYFPNRTPNATYAAMISQLDEEVGAIINKLKELGLYENTLIIFSSDNGPTYAGGVDPIYFDSAKPFKGEFGWGKGFVNEGGLRVPMIATWPGKIKENSSSDLISAFYDILPTLAEISGSPTPDSIDGISILSTLIGSGEQKEHDFLFWDYPEYGGQQAVRMGHWKGIRKNIKKEGNLEIELYDLTTDLQELNNVAVEHPDVVEKIAAIMNKEHTMPEVSTFIMPALGDQ